MRSVIQQWKTLFIWICHHMQKSVENEDLRALTVARFESLESDRPLYQGSLCFPR